jgi:hypothetical protein
MVMGWDVVSASGRGTGCGSSPLRAQADESKRERPSELNRPVSGASYYRPQAGRIPVRTISSQWQA